MRRIRIIEKKREPTFTERLEEKAKRIVSSSQKMASTNSVEAIMRSEIALTLSQINSVRNLHEKLRRNLLRLECYIDTEIMRRTPRLPAFIEHRIAERDMLRARLLTIEAERRRLAVVEEKELRELHGRLCSSLQKHSHIRFQNPSFSSGSMTLTPTKKGTHC